jgi:hypothetical protein
MIYALALIALVGVALTVLSASFIRRARATHEGAVRAQLRVLMAYGVDEALKSQRPGEMEELGLPGELRSAGYSLRVIAERGSESAMVVRVRADCAQGVHRVSVTERLTLVREGKGWQVVGATLE